MERDVELRDAARTYTRMRAEYEYDGGVFDEDEPRVARAKEVLGELDTADRAIFTLYADIGSVRKVAELLGVSRGSAHKEIVRIRKEILRRYGNI